MLVSPPPQDLIAVANLGDAVDDARRPDPAVAADPHPLADGRVGANDGPGADLRRGMHDRGRVDVGRHRRPGGGGLESHHQLGLGGDLVVDARDRAHARDRLTARAGRDLQGQAVARHDLQPELRIVHAAQPGAPDGGAPGTVHEQDGRDLGERLDHQDARHHRRAGKMPLEEVLVDGDVLNGLDPASGLVLGNGVDQRRGIAVTEPIDSLGDVDGGHGEQFTVYSSQFTVRSSRFAVHGSELVALALELLFGTP